MRRGGHWLLLCALLVTAAPAAAAEDDQEGPRQAIQNRKYVLRHEVTLALGTVPIDAYYKGLTGTFGYTFHFNHSWAWELFSVTYSKNFWTSLREDLEANWRNPASPTVIPELQILADSNLVFKPLYGKLAYLNRSLVYGEFYVAAGPAGARYNTGKYYAGVDVGFGFRVHLSRFFSTRFDLRYYRFQQVDKLKGNDNVLFLQLGLSFNLR